MRLHAPPCLLVALLAVAFGTTAVSGCSSAPRRSLLDPVYTWKREGKPTYWRYVPLTEHEERQPSQVRFDELRLRCAESGGLASEPERCLGALGFYEAECSDGRDNDADGLIDHPDDPGCAETHALTESPACDDGRDNDGDGQVDWDGGGVAHPDAECAGQASGTREQPRERRYRYLPF